MELLVFLIPGAFACGLVVAAGWSLTEKLKKPARSSNLQDWVIDNFDTMPQKASGRGLAEHVVVIMKLYNQSPTDALTILDVAGSVFALELVAEESETATKH